MYGLWVFVCSPTVYSTGQTLERINEERLEEESRSSVKFDEPPPSYEQCIVEMKREKSENNLQNENRYQISLATTIQEQFTTNNSQNPNDLSLEVEDLNEEHPSLSEPSTF